MTPRDLIQKKRDGGELTRDEIAFFIRGYLDGRVADYQVSALLMAIYFQGMTAAETIALTAEMRDSGRVLDLSGIPGKKIDKHSTGGVGDKTSIMVASIAADCGVVVPMITGRALGHTGGTLDKLQSIPRFEPKPATERVVTILRDIGAVIMGQTVDIAPADGLIYALRDVTATVESIPLITASILSKKLAAGIDGLVMDVKTGSGAFMPTLEKASDLARSLVDVGRKMKTKVVVFITDMEQPLGRAVGNSLEIRECIEFLEGNAAEDLETVTIALASQMIHMSGRAKTVEEGSRMAFESVSQGGALKRFRDILRAQGGAEQVLDKPDIMPAASHVHELRAKTSGYITRCDAQAIGRAAVVLGAGRNKVDDIIDPSVGFLVEKKLGDRVARGDTLCRIHWNDENKMRAALSIVQQAFEIKPRAETRGPLIHAVLEG
jgi:pyrimidine-nucleoside phosphorylase/thymidine phosphorylase